MSDISEHLESLVKFRSQLWTPEGQSLVMNMVTGHLDELTALATENTSLREQLRLAQERLHRTREMLNIAAELLPIPEHSQGDDWFEKERRIHDFLAAESTDG